MNQDLNLLYPEIIKAHNRTPYHFESRSDGDRVTAYNTICGDRFDIFIATNQDRIGSLYFHGFGCSVSKASASILVQTLEGKTPAEALALCELFLTFVSHAVADERGLAPEFLAFSDVRKFPGRLDCATLAWKEMKAYLKEKINNMSR